MRAQLASLVCVGVFSCGTSPLLPGPGDGGDAGDASISDAGSPDAGLDCSQGVSASADIVLTERGPVRGVVAGGTRAFLGIPYVKPPVGALRWRAPETDFTCWSGVREATSWTPACPQILQAQGVPFDAGAPVEGQEDCLTLNVFTPAAPVDGGAPVMFFIHGGGNTGGSASEVVGATSIHLYDGRNLAARANAVVVTFEYRLGALGFLALSALDAESDDGISGNYGLADQQAALRWVQRNIARFGGDASRVMMFGESAGAVDTCMQLVSTGSSGLFSRAAMESGACQAVPIATKRLEGNTWLAGTGCASSPNVAACLRALTPEQLIRAYPVPVVVGGKKPEVSWGPVIDGVRIAQAPLDTLKNGAHAKVPLLVGSNGDETNLTMPLVTTEAESLAFVSALVGPTLAQSALNLYPTSTYGTPRKALVQLTTDAFFGCSARHAARAAARGQPGVGVYRYLFTRAPVALRGAFHGVELTYVFAHLADVTTSPSAADLAVESSVVNAWANFAATGNPNVTGAPAWALYSSTEPVQRLDSPVTEVKPWRNAECDFWDGVTQTSIPPPP